jgi:hypothetical protein
MARNAASKFWTTPLVGSNVHKETFRGDFLVPSFLPQIGRVFANIGQALYQTFDDETLQVAMQRI